MMSFCSDVLCIDGFEFVLTRQIEKPPTYDLHINKFLGTVIYGKTNSGAGVSDEKDLNTLSDFRQINIK
ncbi:MAG: hypothetical protein DHS20C01_37290 [marine bacterium B5-7]|nr:MAG: hypothetical protein DHS20C01_37290 [marine bacterium B5-7]